MTRVLDDSDREDDVERVRSTSDDAGGGCCRFHDHVCACTDLQSDAWAQIRYRNLTKQQCLLNGDGVSLPANQRYRDVSTLKCHAIDRASPVPTRANTAVLRIPADLSL